MYMSMEYADAARSRSRLVAKDLLLEIEKEGIR